MKKKSIKIAHLYYDLMNLYGENGNIRALEEFIKRQGGEPIVSKLSIGDKIDFREYDFYYIGSGSKENERIVLEDLWKYKKKIEEAIDAGKVFLATGNAMELFGKKIKTYEDVSIDCLGLLSYSARETSTRLVSEIFYEFEALDTKKGRNFVAFKNADANIVNNEEERLFNFPDSARRNNFFGMYLIGPVLIRNPYFTDYILKIVFENKGYNYIQKDDRIEYRAYYEFVKNFISDDNLD
ncbi:MAG TPA: hypothetical protein DCY94_01615 [Firmicutes bacterium]|nr:hypothetical protein [Bacillota bacterium]